MMDERTICPCCRRHYFSELNAFEICPVCGWEDDKLQRENPDYAGGANRLSLNEARELFARSEAEGEMTAGQDECGREEYDED